MRFWQKLVWPLSQAAQFVLVLTAFAWRTARRYRAARQPIEPVNTRGGAGTEPRQTRALARPSELEALLTVEGQAANPLRVNIK